MYCDPSFSTQVLIDGYECHEHIEKDDKLHVVNLRSIRYVVLQFDTVVVCMLRSSKSSSCQTPVRRRLSTRCRLQPCAGAGTGVRMSTRRSASNLAFFTHFFLHHSAIMPPSSASKGRKIRLRYIGGFFVLLASILVGMKLPLP